MEKRSRKNRKPKTENLPVAQPPSVTNLLRPFKLVSQKLSITSINFQRKVLMGSTTLNIVLLKDDIKKIKLNCRQSRICKLLINGVESESFQYQDPSLNLTQRLPKARDLKFLSSRHIAACQGVDSDIGKGELTIDLPKEAAAKKDLKICLHFMLEDPQAGLHFIIDDPENTHLYTSGTENASRLWFPCVDSYTEPCVWELDFTVDNNMTAISCGLLREKVSTPDRRRHTFHYELNVPTAAPNICLVIGIFEIVVDPRRHENTHFCTPELSSLLRHSTANTHVIFEFLEELLGFSFPFTCYKQVFVAEAYAEVCAYSTVSVFNSSLLHYQTILDQTPDTMRKIAYGIIRQLFGCFISPESWSDHWVVVGIAGYLHGLWIREVFGHSEYSHWLKREMQALCDYELKTGPLVMQYEGRNQDANERHFPHASPHTIPECHSEMIKRKSHLIVRKIELSIGQALLIQSINKLLRLAKNVAGQKISRENCSAMLLSTHDFLKSIFTVSGKDLNSDVEKWTGVGGVVEFDSSFHFNRKRNTVELELRQNLTSPGAVQYVGPLSVRLQELDGTFKHTIQVEENVIKHDIPCHSKSRRNKRKKIPLMNGDEADIDLNAMDPDSPVLWIRIDPDMSVMRRVNHEQPDYMWQYQAKFERDPVGQVEAIAALRNYPTMSTSKTLLEVIAHQQFFYKVRTQACDVLRHVLNTIEGDDWTGPQKMIELFSYFFCCDTNPRIVMMNNFADLNRYFLQRALLESMSKLRTNSVSDVMPKGVFNFVFSVIKMSDNTENLYSDNYYRATLVDCLTNMITPAVSLHDHASPERLLTSDDLSPEAKIIVQEIVRFLNMEKCLPSYQYTVTASCLRALRKLQRLGHCNPDQDLFKSYTRAGHYQKTRLVAFECLVDVLKTTQDWELLQWLLGHVRNDNMPKVRVGVLRMLFDNPPFTHEQESPLNSPEVVEELWKIINHETCHDAKLRCEAIKLYNLFFGTARPACMPAAADNRFVVGLKAKKPRLPPSAAIDAAIQLIPVQREKRQQQPLMQPMQQHHHSSPNRRRLTSQDSTDGSGIKMKIKFGGPATPTQNKTTVVDESTRIDAAQSLLWLSSTPQGQQQQQQQIEEHQEPAEDLLSLNSSPSPPRHPLPEPHQYQPQPFHEPPPMQLPYHNPYYHLQLKEKKKKKKNKHHKHHKQSKHHHRSSSSHHQPQQQQQPQQSHEHNSDWSSPATPVSSVNSPACLDEI